MVPGLIPWPFRRSAFSRSDFMGAERSRGVTTPGLPNAGRRAAVGINRVATFSRAMNLPPLGGTQTAQVIKLTDRLKLLTY